MSDEQAETWRVVEESGEERIVEVKYVTDRSFPYWEAWCHADRRGGMLSQNSARHAVLELAANHKWNVVEVLAPGQTSRSETLAAARAEGALAMRAAAVAAVKRRAEELDASVTDEEAADDEEGYGRFQEALELVEVLGALPIPETPNTETT